MKKFKSFIAVLIVVMLIATQCITSYASDSENISVTGSSTAATENSVEEKSGVKLITAVDGYDLAGKEPYQKLAVEYGAAFDEIPMPETLPVSVLGQSETVKIPVSWNPADGEEWNPEGSAHDENGNPVSCRLVADFGSGYALADENAELPWIELIHQSKNVKKAASRAALPTSEQSSHVWYTTSGRRAFDIMGVSGSSASIRTSYNNNGYYCVFKVDGAQNNDVQFGGNGITKTVNGMNITQTLSIVNDGAYIRISYDVNNPTTVAHTIGLANWTDVQINSNDRAPIYPTGTGARMAESDTGAQFNMICKNAYGVTDTDTIWYGVYNQCSNNLWGASTTNTLTNTDSGIAISWHDRVIQPGQTKTYSYLLGIGKSANPPQLGSEISAVVNPQTVDVSASVKDIVGMTDKLYYVLDMGTDNETEPGVLDTKAGNGSFQNMGGIITRPKTWQAGEVHTVSVWVMNDANAMSTIKTVAIFIEDNEDQGDVMRPAQNATLTFAANGGSGTAPTNMSAYELQTVTLPNNTFTAPAGKQFGGWQDTTGNVYPAGSDYRIPENLPSNTMQFKAYWILTSESYYYLDIYEEQLTGSKPYKKTNATITNGTVGAAVNISASQLTIPEGFVLNTSKSKLSGTIANAANPLHLEAYLDRQQLTVTFDNGISSMTNDEVKVKYGATVPESAIKTLSAQTYATFGGWFTSPGGKGNVFNAERKIKDNQTVYAYWIPKEVNVTFDYNYVNPKATALNGRTATSKLTPQVDTAYEMNLAGKIASYPAVPSRWQDISGNSFEFEGWYLGDQKISAETLFNYEPATLVAHWKQGAAVSCMWNGNGTVTGQGFYTMGSDVTISWQAAPGWHVSHVLIDNKWVGGDKLDNPTHIFTDINGNHNVFVTFEEDGAVDPDPGPDPDNPDIITPDDNYYLITTHKYGTSKIEITDSFSVKEGESARVEWSVPSGYKITKVLINGLNGGQKTIDRGYLQIDTVTGNHTVDVYAEPVTNFVQQNGYYNISTAITNGTITNSATVAEGTALYTVDWTVDAGYHVKEILIDGVPAADLTITSCSFDNITANHTVKVICEPDDPTNPDTPPENKNLFVDTAIFGGPGSITPSSFVSTGDNAEITWNITADIPEQYEVGYVYVDGEAVELDENDNLSYTFDDIDSDHKVEVYLIPNLVQFNVTYEGEGSVSPSQTLLYATDYHLTATPAADWVLDTIEMDGKQIYPATTFMSRLRSFFGLRAAADNVPLAADFSEIYNVVETHNVKVTFKKADGSLPLGVRHNLKTTLNGVGTISPSRLVIEGESADVTWNIPDGYTVESVFLKRQTDFLIPQTVTGNTLTVNNIQSDVEVIVNTKPVPPPDVPEPVTYNLSTKIDDGGNITSSLSDIAEGEQIEVKWSTDEAQWVSKVIIDGVERPELVEKNSVLLTMDQDHSVEVKLNLAESKFYLDIYSQRLNGEYEFMVSMPFDSRVNSNIELDSTRDFETPAGFSFNADKSNLKGTVTGLSKPLHLTAYFDMILTLDVNYLNLKGEEIAPGITETYKLNDAYTTKAADPRPYGYVLTETPENYKGRMTESTVTVDYIYEQMDSTIVINYLDENGDKIPPEIIQSKVIGGKALDDYYTTAENIYGYDLNSEKYPANANGRFEEDQQVINYYYTLKESSVKLDFIGKDINGNTVEISPTQIIEGKVYEDYTADAQKIIDKILASDAVYGYYLADYPVAENEGKIAEKQINLVYNFVLKDASVVVNYVDSKGNEIDDPVILSGKVFGSYQTSPKEIRGYTLVKSPAQPSGIFTEDTITLEYVYAANDSSVIVNYRGTDGVQLDTVVLNGKVAQTYKTEAKKFKGYELTAVPANDTGKYKADIIAVNYIYSPNDTSLVVNFLNREGKAVADSEAYYSKFNQKYETSPKNIFGYNLVEVPDNANGSYTEYNIVVNYVYELRDSEVTANYVDLEGNKLAESEVISGKYFDDYKTIQKTIPGYKLTAVPSNSRGIFNEDVITVDYVYVLKDTAVIVNYINENGKSVAPSEAINGKVFDEYSTKPKELYGYNLIETPDNTSGILTENQIIVNYIYRLKDAQVIVNHLDENSNKLAESTVINGKVFDWFDTAHLYIYGYEFIDVSVEDSEAVMLMRMARETEKSEPQDYSGKMKESVIVVNYYYSLKDAEVIVKYVDENGNELSETDVINGIVGDAYSAKAKDIAEYKLLRSTDNETGEMTEAPITVVYTYKRVLNIDTNGDGKPDVNIDTDGDSKPDINIDTDDDGKPDVNVDTDGDGKPNINIDTTGDGKPNINIDADNDGKPDVNVDTDNDGKPDVNIDTTGDGKPNINIDTDGDGVADVNIDTDGDGIADKNIVNTGSGDMFKLIFFIFAAILSAAMLVLVRRKSFQKKAEQ